MIKANDGIEAVEIRLIYRDRRRKQTIRVAHPQIDYSITNDIHPIYSMGFGGGDGAPTEYVIGGPSKVEFGIKGYAYPKPTKRRQSSVQTRRDPDASKRPIPQRRSQRQ